MKKNWWYPWVKQTCGFVGFNGWRMAFHITTFYLLWVFSASYNQWFISSGHVLKWCALLIYMYTPPYISLGESIPNLKFPRYILSISLTLCNTHSQQCIPTNRHAHTHTNKQLIVVAPAYMWISTHNSTAP